VMDLAGGGDPGEDAAEAAEDALGAEDGGELGGGLDAVLEGDDECVGAEERAHVAGGVGDLPGLDAEEDDVGRTQFGWGVGSTGGLDHEIAFGACDAQPAFTHSAEGLASGDESDVLAGLGEPASEVGTDGAGAEDGYLQAASPLTHLTEADECNAAASQALRSCRQPKGGLGERVSLGSTSQD